MKRPIKRGLLSSGFVAAALAALLGVPRQPVRDLVRADLQMSQDEREEYARRLAEDSLRLGGTDLEEPLLTGRQCEDFGKGLEPLPEPSATSQFSGRGRPSRQSSEKSTKDGWPLEPVADPSGAWEAARLGSLPSDTPMMVDEQCRPLQVPSLRWLNQRKGSGSGQMASSDAPTLAPPEPVEVHQTPQVLVIQIEAEQSVGNGDGAER